MKSEEFSALKKSTKWPFCKMAVGDIIDVTGMNGKANQYICVYAHNYGNMTNKKFETLTHEGKFYVKRVS